MSTLHAPPGQKPPSQKPTDATRHMCTGVHVNEAFRDYVMSEVSTSPHRRIAPSYGFDIVPVLRHAWLAAHATACLRLILLCTALVPLLTGHVVTAALCTSGLCLLWLLDYAREIATDVVRTEEVRAFRGTRGRSTLVSIWKDVGYRNQAQKLRRIAASITVVTLMMAVLGVRAPEQAIFAGHLGCFALLATGINGALRQFLVNRIQHSPTLRPDRLSKREKVAARQQQHECVVYRRPEHTTNNTEDPQLLTLFEGSSPFVGAGATVYEFDPPMIQPLLKPSDDTKTPLRALEHGDPPFRTHALVEHVKTEVEKLRTDHESVRLPVKVRDRIYVAESEVSSDRSLLTQGIISVGRKRNIIDGKESQGLHFIEVTVDSHGSELVTTLLLHVRVRGRTLSLFGAGCALTRLPEDFQFSEEYGQSGKRAITSSFITSFFQLPQEARRIKNLFRYFYFLAKSALLPPDMTNRPMRNVRIGTRTGAREEHAQEWSKVHLDRALILEKMKTIERRIFNATSDFLREHDVDTSGFDKNAQKIFQNSFNIGSNTTINGSALGHGSKATNIGKNPSHEHPPSPETDKGDQQ